MPRLRPYIGIGSSELIEQLFDAAFEKDAKRYEDLLYEVQGGEDTYRGRSNLDLVRTPLLKAARRVFELDT